MYATQSFVQQAHKCIIAYPIWVVSQEDTVITTVVGTMSAPLLLHAATNSISLQCTSETTKSTVNLSTLLVSQNISVYCVLELKFRSQNTYIWELMYISPKDQQFINWTAGYAGNWARLIFVFVYVQTTTITSRRGQPKSCMMHMELMWE